jgi:hypothetical protein
LSAANGHTTMSPEEKVKLVALYFPQFHRIPENDQWWGKGFTDWTNVRKAEPQFPGHYQPRVPKDDRYYDQSELATIKWQVELAKSHGLYGFCHYHYWFDGKQLLETPTNLMLENKDIDFPFCLAWANEPWSRRWDGREQDLLLAQTHRPDPALWEKHFEYLFRAWSDARAIRIDGKPVFMIYRPHLVIQLGEMLAFWTRLAQERGLPGLFFVAMKQYEYPQPELLKFFDASMHFQPFEALASPDFRWLPREEEKKPAPATVEAAITMADPAEPPVIAPGFVRKQWKKLPYSFRLAAHTLKWQLKNALMVVPRRAFALLSKSVQARVLALRTQRAPALVIWDYDSMWTQMIKVEQDQGLTTFPGAFVDWDNTPRYGKRAHLFKGASPERFRYWFNQLVKVTATRPAKERIIFLNAWNEWAEGTYLEPDERYGKQYLEIVRDALGAQNEAS